MIRGTTPTLVFRLDTELDFDSIKTLWVTLKSSFAERTFDESCVEINTEEHTVTLEMTQEDTLQLKGDVECQIRILLKNEKAYATNIKKISLNQILRDGVIR